MGGGRQQGGVRGAARGCEGGSKGTESLPIGTGQSPRSFCIFGDHIHLTKTN